MLIRFAVQNFMSFKDLTEFSMAAGKIVRHSNHLIVHNNQRILKGAFLFGANAGGKSNFIRAIDFARNIIVKGLDAVNCDKKYFRIDEDYRTKPGVFQFDFISNGHTYSYGFAISYLGESIEEEWLYQTDKDDLCVFLRHPFEDGRTTIVETDLCFDNEEQKQRFRVFSESIGNPKMRKILFLTDVDMRSPDEPEYQAFRDVLSWFQNLEIISSHGKEKELFDYADESDGARRLFELIPMYQAAMQNRVILIDEINRSLHSKVTQEFVRYFYDLTDGIATQIIAASQDLSIMDLDLLRQDEIWFIERQTDHSSKLYSLNKYKNRFDKKVGKDYLLERYGATPIFRQFALVNYPPPKDSELEETKKHYIILREILRNDFSYSPKINAKIVKLFSMYLSKPSKRWIYPGAIKRNTGMDIRDVYRLLSELEQYGFVESWYEMCCGHCWRIIGRMRRFNELPETFECKNCGETMQILENTVKIYQIARKTPYFSAGI